MDGDAETAEGAGTETNGQSNLSVADAMRRDRAAFIAGMGIDEDEKPAKGKAVADDGDADDEEAADVGDEDEDLDADEESAAVDADEDAEEVEDDDSDLDDDKPTKPDPEVSKRLEQVRRTDKRLREQREQQFAARERQIADREEQLKPRLVELERFEKLQARGPAAIIEGLLGDIDEDDAEQLGRRIFALTKAGKADPKAKAYADHFAKERARDKELNSIKQKLEQQEAEKAKAAEAAEERRNIDVYLGKVAKAASDKTPLAKMYLAKDPDGAKAELEFIAANLSNRLGQVPDHKTVMVAFEKHQRSLLRRYGIDPKTHKPATATAASSAAKTTPKPGDKKTAGKSKPAATEDKPFTKADFVSGKFD